MERLIDAMLLRFPTDDPRRVDLRMAMLEGLAHGIMLAGFRRTIGHRATQGRGCRTHCSPTTTAHVRLTKQASDA
jgi:hypothetical protein